jgi:hypothetical protein
VSLVIVFLSLILSMLWLSSKLKRNLIITGSKNLYIRKKTFFHLDNVKVKNQAFIIDLMT